MKQLQVKRLHPFITSLAMLLPSGLTGAKTATSGYSLEKSEPFFAIFIKMTTLNMEKLPGPVAFKTCKSSPDCPGIYQKIFSGGPCLSRLSAVEAEAKTEKIISLNEKWLGECRGYFDNPLVSTILKKNISPPESVSKNDDGHYQAFWTRKKGLLTVTAYCPKKEMAFRECHILQLHVESQKLKPGKSGEKHIPF